MITLDEFQGTNRDLIQIALDQTPAPQLSKIEELWHGITLPSLSEIVSNLTLYPAICPIKKSAKNTIIKTDENGRFYECLDTPDGEINLDQDAIQWTVGGRGKLKHNPRDHFSRFKLARIVSCGLDAEHYTRGTPEHCHRLSCPDCFSYNTHRDASERAQRIFAMGKMVRRAHGWKMGRTVHLTVSVPPEQYYRALTTDGYKRLSKDAQKIARACGVVGGVLIFHPFRQNGVNDDDDLGEDYTPAPTNDGDKHSARFAPHFHIIGFGWIENTSEMYTKTGWIVKNLRTGKNSIKSLSDIEGLIVYLRSHTGVIDDSSPAQPRIMTAVYFGACGHNSMAKAGTLDKYTPQICPECGEPLILHDVHGCNGDTSPRGQMFRRDRYPIYTNRDNVRDLALYLKDNAGDPAEIVRHLDRRPDRGAMAINFRQFEGLSAPLDVQTLDGTLHTIVPVWNVSPKPVKPKNQHDEHKTINGANTIQSPPAPDGGFGDYFPDYHYPPVPEGVY